MAGWSDAGKRSELGVKELQQGRTDEMVQAGADLQERVSQSDEGGEFAC